MGRPKAGTKEHRDQARQNVLDNEAGFVTRRADPPRGIYQNIYTGIGGSGPNPHNMAINLPHGGPYLAIFSLLEKTLRKMQEQQVQPTQQASKPRRSRHG